MTTTDCHLSLHQDAPHGADRRHPAGRLGFERSAPAALRISVPKLPPDAWQAAFADRLAVADPRCSAERDDYVESSLELLRGLEVIEWLHVPLPEHRLPFQASR
jgi:hypothetical protein